MKVLIAAGGSGGHIFPAVALARRLKEKDGGTDILFVGSDKTLDKSIFLKEGFKFALLSGNKLSYKLSPKLIVFFIKLFLDTIKSFFIVLSYRPDATVGFGGYVSTPISVASCLLGVPVTAHEQNVIPGRANRVLFKLASRIAISFRETEKYLGPDRRKSVYTGNPIRASVQSSDRRSSAKRLGFETDKFTILVVGGSQGARRLNEKFVDALSQLDREARDKVQVIHITGVKDYGWAVKEYEKIGLENRVFSFIDRIEDAYSASDLVVSRSGASALFELALFGKPMILVPYPYAMSHQRENAKAFSKNGAAIEMDEMTLSAEKFKNRIVDLMNDRSALTRLGDSAMSLCVRDASGRLADVVLNLR